MAIYNETSSGGARGGSSSLITKVVMNETSGGIAIAGELTAIKRQRCVLAGDKIAGDLNAPVLVVLAIDIVPTVVYATSDKQGGNRIASDVISTANNKLHVAVRHSWSTSTNNHFFLWWG